RRQAGSGTAVSPPPPFGEWVGGRGSETHPETLTPHPPPLPMGEGANRVCRITVTRSKTSRRCRLCGNNDARLRDRLLERRAEGMRRVDAEDLHLLVSERELIESEHQPAVVAMAL